EASTTVRLAARYGDATWITTLPVGNVALGSLTAVTGGFGVQAAVKLDNAAPAGGAAVALTSSDPSLLRVPDQVVVPAGERENSVTVEPAPVDAATSVTLSASYGGVTRSVTVQLLPHIARLTVTPAVVPGGDTATGTITLSGPAPRGGLPVRLYVV